MGENQKLVRFSELNTNIAIEALKDSPYLPSQQVAFINSENGTKIIFQTPHVITEAFGLAPRESQFFTTERSRAFFKLALCHDRKKYSADVDYEQIEAFYNKMKEFDNYFSSDEVKDKLFGKNKNKYEYNPIIRNTGEDNDDERTKNNISYKPPYLKLKIDLDYNNNMPKLLLFDKDIANNTRNTPDINTIDDIHNYLKFLSKNRYIIEMQRIYASKSNNINGKRHYGVILKMICVECINNYRKIEDSEQNENKIVDFLD